MSNTVDSTADKIYLITYHDEEAQTEVAKVDKPDQNINDVLEGAGCGFGTLLYTFGTFLFCCLQGSEVVMLAIVGPVLKCDWQLDSFSLTVLQISTNFAMIFSTGLTSPLGDKFGRRPVALIGAIGVTITGVLCAFTQAYWQFLTLRLVMGLFFGIGTPPAVVLSGEIPPKRYRALAMSGFSLAWGVGVSISGAIAYFVMEPYGWRGLVFSIPIAFSPCIIFFGCIRDSPRYDYYSGNVDEAEQTIKQIYKLNGKGDVEIKLEYVNVPLSAHHFELYKTYKILEKTDNLKNTIFIILLGMSAAFCYHLYAYSMPRLLNEGYCTDETIILTQSCEFDKKTLLSIEMVNFAEPVGLIIILFLLEGIGRRKAFMGVAILTLLLPTATYFCVGRAYLLTFLLFLNASVACITMAPSVLVNEYMPTIIRSCMMSFEAAAAWSGAIFAIMLAEYALNFSPRVALGVLQAAAFIPVCCLYMLRRETSGEDLT